MLNVLAVEFGIGGFYGSYSATDISDSVNQTSNIWFALFVCFWFVLFS